VTVPPILLQAARHADIRGRELAVLVELHEWLDIEEFRTIAAWRVAERLQMDECNVYRAIRALHRGGFLERGARLGNAYTFRIPRNAAAAA
jgi:predicted transcriptional regulator